MHMSHGDVCGVLGGSYFWKYSCFSCIIHLMNNEFIIITVHESTCL